MYSLFLKNIAPKKHLLKCIQKNRLYHIMNNMKYSKIIPELNKNNFAQKFELNIEDKIFTDGAYVFTKNGKIEAIYDYVNQTLFTDNEIYLEI
jgi:HKD family nuclease